jgi:signal transduction histidine kinase
MQIRTRLTLQFLLLGGLIMIIASLAIYYSSAGFRKDDFSTLLRNKARNTAKLLLDAKEIDANRVMLIERDNPVKFQNEKIIILNFLNDVIYSSDEKGEIVITNEILEKIRLGLKVEYRQEPYDVIGTLVLSRLDRFVVIAAAVDSQGFLYLRKLRTILIVVSLIILLIIFAAGWFYSARALKPISEVIKNVEDISITSLNLRVPEGNGTDEIGKLARTFNRMLERLEESFAMQKDFIANASHELRTPLTSINGQLEVLMMKDRSADDYRTALASVLEDIKSLINLSNRLLLIARTSAESPVNMYKKVRIDEILWQAREEIMRFNTGYRINISIDNSLTDSDQMLILGDESLLKTAATNIIDNACKYSQDKSVNIKFEPGEKWIAIAFEDRGIGISEDDQKKIFEPFYRGTNAMSVHGTGIGLALVNRIVRNHNGSIHISSKVGKGTKVILTFPIIT